MPATHPRCGTFYLRALFVCAFISFTAFQLKSMEIWILIRWRVAWVVAYGETFDIYTYIHKSVQHCTVSCSSTYACMQAHACNGGVCAACRVSLDECESSSLARWQRLFTSRVHDQRCTSLKTYLHVCLQIYVVTSALLALYLCLCVWAT